MAEVVPIDVFLAAIPDPSKYEVLVKSLDAYRCFVTNGGERERGIDNHNGGGNGGSRNGRYGGGGRSKGHGRQNASAAGNRMRQERPRIGMRELSREAICKKEFLSLTNKVSPQNKDAIVRKVLAILTPQYATMYCHVIWAIMQRPVQIYQNIYAEFARIVAVNTPMPDKLVFRGAWEACFDQVTAGNEAFVQVPVMFIDVSNEGVFQEWSVWKKCRINLVKGCVFLCHYGVFTKSPSFILDPVLVAVDAALCLPQEDAQPPHIIDYWLEILGVSWEAEKDVQPLHDEIIQKLKHWAKHTEKLPAKCRFKIESLCEAHCPK
jgi:hypothetical protein